MMNDDDKSAKQIQTVNRYIFIYIYIYIYALIQYMFYILYAIYMSCIQ